jgi:hypothetical protein
MELEDTSTILKECIQEFDQTFKKYYIKDEKTGRPGSEDASNKKESLPPASPPVENQPPIIDIKKPKKHSKEKLKKLYKKLSIITHPDKGGDEEDFLALGKYYEDGNLMELIKIAEKYNIEYKIEKDDEEVLETSAKKIEDEIYRMKDTLAWNWVNGDLKTKLRIIKIIEKETKRTINPNELIDELKDKSQKPNEPIKLLNK